jgi:Alpha/beta hydrolase domain
MRAPRRMSTRSAVCAGILALAGGLGSVGPVAAAEAKKPPLPRVEGPITGPGEMAIDALERAEQRSVEDFGYRFEEYFVSGAAAGSSYEVRMLIARPSRLRGFSGQVLVEPKHPLGFPFVWDFTRLYLMRRGHVAVELSTFPQNITGALQGANPERYADLHVSEAQTSDIFAQVGRLLKSKRSPLRRVDSLYMTGHSRSAGPTWPYMDTHHARFRLKRDRPIYDAFFPETSRTAARLGPFPNVDVPTLQLNSQLEVQEVYAQDGIDYRKPDSNKPRKPFRLYEVAGMPHHDSRQNPINRSREPCDLPLNRFPYEPIVIMALDHLIRWVTEGVRPPRAERISVIGGPGGEIELDENDNAVGGVRTTYVDVPFATHSPLNSGPDPFCEVLGSQQPFSLDRLISLYGSHDRYVGLVDKRLDRLVRQGWYLPRYARELRAEAAAFGGFAP